MALEIKGIRFGASKYTSTDDEIPDSGDTGGGGGSGIGNFNTINADIANITTLNVNGALSSTITGVIYPNTTTDLFIFSKSGYTSGIFKYHIKDDTNTGTRAGSLLSSWDDTNISHTETSIVDSGNTTEQVELGTCQAGGNIVVYATNTGGTQWNFKANYVLM